MVLCNFDRLSYLIDDSLSILWSFSVNFRNFFFKFEEQFFVFRESLSMSLNTEYVFVGLFRRIEPL